jgi:hypothetical protein
VEGGRWKVKGGRWKVEGGKWKVEGGKWKDHMMDYEELTIGGLNVPRSTFHVSRST